jgi:predicted RNA-binding Zn ribbon-like protein
MMAPTFALVGGHVALDLLNTVSWRLDPEYRSEGLNGYADVLAWSHQAGLLGESERRALARLARTDPDEAQAELDAFRALREDAYAALITHDAPAVTRIAARQRAGLDRSVLARAGNHWHWREPEPALTTPGDRTARAVVELLTSPDLGLLHQCEDVACGWVYLDTSPRRNRRWCVAADCGNRNRARAFYARQKARRARPTGG